MKTARVALPLIIFFGLAVYLFTGMNDQTKKDIPKKHVFDKAKIIPTPDKPRFEWLLDLIKKESGIDIKFLFLETIGNTSVEEIATQKMDEYGIGGEGKKQRGVLFLYVMDKKRLKIEVGYGLEAHLPDSFVGYLIRNHADPFFEASDPSLGIRLLIRMLQYRIREAALNKEYDPNVLEGGIKLSHLSGGAGASQRVGEKGARQPFKYDQYSEKYKKRFAAAHTVEGTFERYIAWLYGRKFDPDVGLFTKSSSSVFNGMRMTPAYLDYMLMFFAGNEYNIVKRRDLAILYFTDDPLATPLFFNNIGGKWKLNTAAEVRNSQNHVGGVYSWSFNPNSRDEFAKTFDDLLINIRGFYRFKDGANKQLPVNVDVQRDS